MTDSVTNSVTGSVTDSVKDSVTGSVRGGKLVGPQGHQCRARPRRMACHSRVERPSGEDGSTFFIRNAMKAIVYDDEKKEVAIVDDWPCDFESGPSCDSRSEFQAVLKVSIAGICATDVAITKGYVKGFRHVLGHEGVGVVERVLDTRTRVPVAHPLVGRRVVVEINCPCSGAVREDILDTLERDKTYRRNHYPSRTVLGIIGRDGLFAERCLVPLDNCIPVPQALSDIEAAFSEPLAAACRIVEQGLVSESQTVCVIGDGKLGLLIAHVLVVSGVKRVFHFGRHRKKLDLVEGTIKVQDGEMPDGEMPDGHTPQFDVAIEATGSPSGVQLAVELLRPMGTLVLKTTCSLDADPKTLPNWSALANDIVVNEKTLVGSRCGPMKRALELLEEDARTRQLVVSMVDRIYTMDEGLNAFAAAQTKGSLKVLIRPPLGCLEELNLANYETPRAL